MRKGQSTIVSISLGIAVMIMAVLLALTIGNPMLESMQDTASIEQSIQTLTTLDEAIREVGASGKGASQTMSFRNSRGAYLFDIDNNQIFYEIETDSSIVSTQNAVTIGPVEISANTDVTVQEDSVNGTSCWRMENEHIEACIRKIDQTFDPDGESGLAGYWRFNEGTGQWTNDSTTNDNHGKLGGSLSTESSDPSWDTGIQGDSLQFDGSDDRVTVEKSSSLNLTDNLTLAAWVKSQETDTSVIDTYDCSNGGGYRLKYRDTEIQFSFNNGTQSFHKNSQTFSSIQDEWSLLTVTYDRPTIRFYLNGQPQGEVTEPEPIAKTTSDLLLGDQPSGCGSNPFNGTIDEVRIYNRSLTPEEVEWQYLQRGNMSYINNSELFVKYHNKDLEQTVTPDMKVLINGSSAVIAGEGHTTPARTGTQLGSGRVQASIDSSQGQEYSIYFDLFSGSDFLKIEVTD